MNEVILTVFPNGSTLGQSFGLRLSSVIDSSTSNCNLLKVILDNETHTIEDSLLTYQNQQRIANPAINDWIFRNNLNEYRKGIPPKLKFSLVNQNNEHIYKYLSRVR